VDFSPDPVVLKSFFFPPPTPQIAEILPYLISMDNCQFILLVTDISKLSSFVSLCCQELIDDSQPRPIETGYQFSKRTGEKFLV
jgi:hypothetical protein